MPMYFQEEKNNNNAFKLFVVVIPKEKKDVGGQIGFLNLPRTRIYNVIIGL